MIRAAAKQTQINLFSWDVLFSISRTKTLSGKSHHARTGKEKTKGLACLVFLEVAGGVWDLAGLLLAHLIAENHELV